METYACSPIKARVVSSKPLTTALKVAYATLADTAFTPVSIMYQADQFLPHSTNSDCPAEWMATAEYDAALGSFDNIIIEAVVPAVDILIKQGTPTRQGLQLNIKSCTLLLPKPVFLDLNDPHIVHLWECEYLFEKYRTDGEVRRHAPPQCSGRILHKLKYPRFAGVAETNDGVAQQSTVQASALGGGSPALCG